MRKTPLHLLSCLLVLSMVGVTLGDITGQWKFDEGADDIMAEGSQRLTAGNLSMILEQTGSGMRLLQLSDRVTDRGFLVSTGLPLFTLLLRDTLNRDEVVLNSESGWDSVTIKSVDDKTWLVRYEFPQNWTFNGLAVSLSIRAEDAADAFHCGLQVQNPLDRWHIRHVVFPQVALADPGPESQVLFPRGPGEVQKNIWQRSFRYQGGYPGGWITHATMSFLAAYDHAGQAGLYVGMHDPWGSRRDILVESRPNQEAVVFSFDHYAPEPNTPWNSDYGLTGEAVFQLFRGDWFDAAMIYRDWVRKNAKWYPKLSANGREDTPLWMRELPAWTVRSTDPSNSITPQDDVVGPVRGFANLLGVPVGFHWYNWHQIPFDNDLPHFLPPKSFFAGQVLELQAGQPSVYVMPYINGRLWDTRDRGLTDYEFTRIAKAGATKDEDGNPYIEKYGSKETDGSTVQFAVMCPTTEVWRSKMREIILGLFRDYSAKGVYVDQVAAAIPRLCFDPSHGHPRGGGHWWTEGYWRMLEDIRHEKPLDCMLTTECNAEPYIHVFDGYLTYHWQYNGQVPAFPAVYGGAIQMFGRNCGVGPDRERALQMKIGQQLVFGEQIGWFIWEQVNNEPVTASFLRQVVQMRWKLRRFFYAGEMARPPKLVGSIPMVTADWEWQPPTWPVTLDAVLTGAWKLPGEQRLALIFVNLSSSPVVARLDFDTTAYALPAHELKLTEVTPDGFVRRTTRAIPESPPLTVTPTFQRELTFPAYSAWAWLLEPQ
jgi:hypothetical protein